MTEISKVALRLEEHVHADITLRMLCVPELM